MIKRFGSLFAGHIDLGDMGQDATPANERRYSNDELAGVFQKAEDMAIAMDRLGYDSFWMAEHHFQHEGYECIPNLLAVLCAPGPCDGESCGSAAASMSRPCGIPIRLAEDFAAADILTKGRCIFGVGRGYHSREVESLGGVLLDAEANRDLFEEQVEIILKAFSPGKLQPQGCKNYELPAKVPLSGAMRWRK